MQFFFVSGYNKSGTTFIQMLLDAHPAINCPSEQHFKTLFQGLEKLAQTYRSALEFFDERTAQQGIRFNQAAFTEHLFKQGLLKLAEFGATEVTTHIGLNDNSLIDRADIHTRLLPEAKFIFIIRDPRDVGVSLWHHRMRVDPGFADKDQPLDDMILGVCRAWPGHLDKILALQNSRPGYTHIVRYEDLISPQREDALAQILKFMDVRATPDIIAEMFAATEFKKLQKNEQSKKPPPSGATPQSAETTPGFFRSGKRNGWRDILSDEQKAKALDSCGVMLEKFGYDLLQ